MRVTYVNVRARHLLKKSMVRAPKNMAAIVIAIVMNLPGMTLQPLYMQHNYMNPFLSVGLNAGCELSHSFNKGVEKKTLRETFLSSLLQCEVYLIRILVIYPSAIVSIGGPWGGPGGHGTPLPRLWRPPTPISNFTVALQYDYYM